MSLILLVQFSKSKNWFLIILLGFNLPVVVLTWLVGAVALYGEDQCLRMCCVVVLGETVILALPLSCSSNVVLVSLEEAQGLLAMYINTWREMTEPGCSCWCPVTGQEAVGANWNPGGSLRTSGNAGTGWLGRLWSPHTLGIFKSHLDNMGNLL